jgi:hypothetical protein
MLQWNFRVQKLIIADGLHFLFYLFFLYSYNINNLVHLKRPFRSLYPLAQDWLLASQTEEGEMFAY